jgi:gas vesicle protein
MIQYKGAIVLGVLVGAAAGVLLAPEKGSVTRENLKREAKEFKVKASVQTEKAITFLEKQLAILKEKNKSFQTTS